MTTTCPSNNFLFSLIITIQNSWSRCSRKNYSHNKILRHWLQPSNNALTGEGCHDSVQIQHRSSQENISTKEFRVALRVYVGSATKLATTLFSTLRFPRCNWRGRAAWRCGTTIHRHSVMSTRLNITSGVRIIHCFIHAYLFLISRAIVMKASSTLIEFFALVSKNCTPSSSANACVGKAMLLIEQQCHASSVPYLGLGLRYCSLVL